jgi:hypothetical protein
MTMGDSNRGRLVYGAERCCDVSILAVGSQVHYMLNDHPYDAPAGSGMGAFLEFSGKKFLY